MIELGKSARYFRQLTGLTQKEVAQSLGISIVHLSNVENDKATPSNDLLEKYHDNWGVDLYILAWCIFGDSRRLPSAVRVASDNLARVWRSELEARFGPLPKASR